MNKVLLALTILSIFFLSQYQYLSAQFGKNKVQYETFDWKFISSEHFDVYFHQDGEELAKYTAVEAEKSLIKIEKTINFKLTKRISIVVFNSHNQFQQNNVISQFLQEGIGGVTQLYKNNIVIPFQGKYDQFQHVIFHELIHGVLNDMFHGGSLQTSIQNNGFFIPLWLNEGLCEYISNGGMDTETDMFMRDMVIAEKLPKLVNISGYSAYRVGQTFYWYVAEKYGKEKVAEFVNRLRDLKNVNNTFESVFKLDLEEFSDKFEKDLKKYYWTDLDQFKNIDDFATQVTNRKKMGNFYNSSPAISPDGDKIAFISEENGILKIATQSLDKSETYKTIVSSFRQQDFEDLNLLAPGISWDPKSQKIAISAKSGGEDAIFIVDARSGDYDKLTFGLKSIESVQWSPDGTMLTFSASSANKSDIYIYTFKNKKLELITNDVFSDIAPVWSPDSKSVYFISDRNSISLPIPDNFKMWNQDVATSDIYKVDILNKIITQVTNSPEYKKYSMALSPDESKMLFISDENGISNLYELNINSGKILPKTNSITGITQISLSKDASVMVFGAQINGGYDIFKLKYPFDLIVKGDTLPLTKYKSNSNLQRTLVQNIINQSKSKQVQDDKLMGYGDYEISFDDQKLVKPNINVNKQKDSISSIAINDSNFVVKDYKLKFSPDLLYGTPSYNTFWGFQGVSQFIFSDEMGDHQFSIMANLFLDLKNSNVNLTYNYLAGVVDYSFSVFHNVGFVRRNAQFQEDIDSLLRYKSYGLVAKAFYPLDLFNRFEFATSLLILSKADLNRPAWNGLSKPVIIPELAYVHDDVLWGLYAPAEGTRYRVGLLASPKLGSDGVDFQTLNLDFRAYKTFMDYFTFAVRLKSAMSFGANAQKFFLGGTDNWINVNYNNNRIPIDNPEDFAFLNFEAPLRGYSINQINGSKFFLTNFEFRFPLITALLAGPVPILLQGIMGSVFIDAGGAFNDTFKAIETDWQGNKYYNNLRWSSGLGVRTYLLGIPVKMDVAWAKVIDNWTPPQYLFSLGYDF